MSKISFISFCVEYYAEHVNKTSDEVYEIFKKEKLLDLLESDYEDLHGMGKEFLMDYFDQWFLEQFSRIFLVQLKLLDEKVQ